MRTCGPCQACCKIFPVPILGKAENESCRFLCSSGCAIHGDGQLEICREYACYWLDHEETPEECRPDRIGVVVTESGVIAVAGEVLSVFVLNQADPAAHQGPEAARLIDGMVAEGYVLFVIYGLEMKILYDRSRWAAITPDEIETAFRSERQRDAEELKTLGSSGRRLQSFVTR